MGIIVFLLIVGFPFFLIVFGGRRIERAGGQPKRGNSALFLEFACLFAGLATLLFSFGAIIFFDWSSWLSIAVFERGYVCGGIGGALFGLCWARRRKRLQTASE